MGEARVYSAKEVSVSVAGVPIFKGGPGGAADGDFVRVEWDSDAFTDKTGADGALVVREATNDERATVTLILMQPSDGNDLLSDLLTRDRNSPNGAGVGAIEIRDSNGETLLRGQQAWVRKPATVTFGKESGNREWPIRVAALKGKIGGNIRPVGA